MNNRTWLCGMMGLIFAGVCLLPGFSMSIVVIGMTIFLLRYMHNRRKRPVVIVFSYLFVLICLGVGFLAANQTETIADSDLQTIEQTDAAMTNESHEGIAAEATPRNTQPMQNDVPVSLLEKFISFLGIFVLIGLAWLISTNRTRISWRPVVWGVILQLAFGMIVLSPATSTFFFNVVDGGVKKLLSFSEEGATFIFQTVEPHQIVPGFSAEGKSETFIGRISPPVKTFAFWVLPTIIFFSSLMTVLYHIGIMEQVIRFFAWIMQRTMGTSGSETLSAAANIFVGQTEAPLVVKPFIQSMTISELHAVMVGGFATVAGGVMAAYVGFLQDYVPGIAGHLVTASIMSAPAALAISKIIMPEIEVPVTSGSQKFTVEKPDANIVEAAARGASEGMTLTLNVAAMLVAFVAMVAMINWFLGSLGVWIGFALGTAALPLSLESILGWIFAPISWTMGVPWHECATIGRLLGEKLVLTEFIAYMNLADIMKNGFDGGGGQIMFLSQRSAIIASYALCGFANFASIGIQIGGIGGIAPSRRADLARIGIRAMIGGAIAACMTGTIAGILI